MAVRPALARLLIRALARLLGVIALGLAGPALAHGPKDHALAPTCHAYAETRAEADRLRAGQEPWLCGTDEIHADSRRVLLRFELGSDGRVPAQLTSRLARFEAMRIDIIAPDRKPRTHMLFMRDFTPHDHMQQQAPLPEAGAPASAVLVVARRKVLESRTRGFRALKRIAGVCI